MREEFVCDSSKRHEVEEDNYHCGLLMDNAVLDGNFLSFFCLFDLYVL